MIAPPLFLCPFLGTSPQAFFPCPTGEHFPAPFILRGGLPITIEEAIVRMMPALGREDRDTAFMEINIATTSTIGNPELAGRHAGCRRQTGDTVAMFGPVTGGKMGRCFGGVQLFPGQAAVAVDAAVEGCAGIH